MVDYARVRVEQVGVDIQVEDPTPQYSSGAGSTSTRMLSLFELARGGMGRVDVAARLGGSFIRLYAMKRLLPAVAQDEDMRAMFLEEARNAALIRHPNVISVLDVGEDDQGPYLVMDYVEGVTLADLVRARRSYLELDEALYIIEAIARALHAAHELVRPDGQAMGLIHRDVSPSNIMIGVRGEVWLTDFGVAKPIVGGPKTKSGILKGKLGYMSPEQLRFERLDHRSDLFALGVCLFEMLSGRRLYRDKDSTETAARILREPLPDISEWRRDVPDELVAELFALLAKEPASRPQNAEEVAASCRRIAIEEGIDLANAATSLGAQVREAFGPALAERREQIAIAVAARRQELDGKARHHRRLLIGAAVMMLALALGVGVVSIVGGAQRDALPARAGTAQTPELPQPVAQPPAMMPEPQPIETPVEVDTAEMNPEPPQAPAEMPARAGRRRPTRARAPMEPRPSKSRWMPLAP